MTTDEMDLVLPWDYFLQQEEGYAKKLSAIDGFRHQEWKAIRRELLTDWEWDVPEDLEPHWLEVGKAAYWKQQTERKRVFVNDAGDEIPNTTENLDAGHWEMRWFGTDWQHTGPLPANNAGVVARYLTKGLRLRPPVEGVAAEQIVRESAALLEAQGPLDDRPTYTCRRHGVDDKRQFRTWDGYIQHCAHFKEVPTEAPPQKTLETMARFRWFCMLHNVGFNHAMHVARHYKAEMRKPGKAAHQTIDDMLVKEET